MWIVVGLGNPGAEYEDTRHNLGYHVADELLRRAGARPQRHRGYLAASIRIAAVPALVVKPTTYVNRTGAVLQALGGDDGLDAKDVLAVVDDAALPFGKLRLRPSGSAGGHNGLRSMIAALGSDQFPRLRLGVGAPPPGVALEDWVLDRFDRDEARALPDLVAQAADAVERILTLGVDAAIPIVNASPPA